MRDEDSAATPAAPLTGIGVVDVSELLPGPFLSHCLAELGATVTKVERAPHGDLLRTARPGAYTALNHGKTIQRHDLKSADGRHAVMDLVAGADVFVEGARPGVMDRLGLGYAELSAMNPRLVYVSLSGYGQHGPLRTTPGHDLNYQAVSGLLALSGRDGLRPEPAAGLPITDYAGATYALAGTLAALVQRSVNGRGQHLDVSITDAVTHWLGPVIADLRQTGTGAPAGLPASQGGKPGYAAFRTRDDRWLAVGALERHFFTRLLQALGLDAGSTTESNDAAAAGPDDPTRGHALVSAAIAEKIAQLDADDVLSLLGEHDVPVSLVVAPADVPETANSRARRLFAEIDGLPVARFPIRMRGMAGGAK